MIQASVRRARRSRIGATNALDVGELVLADRYEVRAKREDVGALADRIEREAEAVVILELLVGELGAQRRVAHHAVERQQHREQRGQLGDRGDLALHDERRALGVDAGRDPVARDLERVAPDLVGAIDARRQRVHVRDQEVAVVVRLQAHAVLERADPVPEVQSARGLVTGQDARSGHEELRSVPGPRACHREPGGKMYVVRAAYEERRHQRQRRAVRTMRRL